MTIVRPTGGSAAQGEGAPESGSDESTTVFVSGVPSSMRAERLEVQVGQFARAGYVVEHRAEFRVVMVREHKRTTRSRAFDAIRTLGVVPLLMRAPRAYHRVLITVDDSGAVDLV